MTKVKKFKAVVKEHWKKTVYSVLQKEENKNCQYILFFLKVVLSTTLGEKLIKKRFYWKIYCTQFVFRYDTLYKFALED